MQPESPRDVAAARDSMSNPPPEVTGRVRVSRIGPAIVVAAVVLGPGSIVTASRVGCQFGYSLLWVVLAAGVLMIGMTAASMIIGVSRPLTPVAAVAERFGRPAAILVGGALALAIALFQSSNNQALLMAAGGWLPADTLITPAMAITGLLLVNVAVAGLILAGRRALYRRIETAMAILVGAMVLAFGAAMFAAGPSVVELAGGLIPRLPAEGTAGLDALSWMSVAAVVATTFSIAGAFYQSYQVREKGWTSRQLRLGLFDAVIGIGTLAVITAMIMVTAAAGLHGRVDPASLTNAAAVAASLQPAFGSAAAWVFGAGVAAGALSSFVVNAVIGAVVCSDALGGSVSLQSPAVRRWTVVMLAAGWAIASICLLGNIPPVRFIIIAQSLTVLTFPLLAAVMIWQLMLVPRSDRPAAVLPLAALGLIVVVGLAITTMVRLFPS